MRLITSAAILAFAAHAQDIDAENNIDFIPASELEDLPPLKVDTVTETEYVTSALPTEFFGWMDLSMGFLFGFYVPI